MVLFAQNLCKYCATSFVESPHDKGCCNKCLVDYFTEKLKSGIVHGSLSKTGGYFGDEIIQMPRLADTIHGEFKVWEVEEKNGFFLNENDRLEECKFFLVSIHTDKEAEVGVSGGILITCDDGIFQQDSTYQLTLSPYFKRDQNVRIVDEKKCTVIHGGPRVMFDLVYKRWLIPHVDAHYNYFFVSGGQHKLALPTEVADTHSEEQTRALDSQSRIPDTKYYVFDTVSHHWHCLAVQDTFVIDSIWVKEVWTRTLKFHRGELTETHRKAKKVPVFLIQAHPISHPSYRIEIIAEWRKADKNDILINKEYPLFVRPQMNIAQMLGDIKFGAAKMGRKKYGYFQLEAWAVNLYVCPQLKGLKYLPASNGRYVDYFSNGKIAEKGRYKKGKKSGLWQGFSNDGFPSYRYRYRQGEVVNMTRYHLQW